MAILPNLLRDQCSSRLLEGKVFITGGNAGIGFQLCKILYQAGATIYMASRTKVSPQPYLLAPKRIYLKSQTQSKAEAVIETITPTTPPSPSNGKLKFLQLDLNSLLSVKAAATTFASQESHLDIL
jgi:NAD(P)-dependent dehydrogenase (short-subunit alcohol dehydrogenase family)